MENKLSKEYLLTLKCTGEAGAGLVKVTVDAMGFPVKVEIDKSIFSETNASLISDLFVAATKIAIDNADLLVQDLLTQQYLEKMQEYEKYLGTYETAKDLGNDDGKYNN